MGRKAELVAELLRCREKLADTTACNERQALKLADMEDRQNGWRDTAVAIRKALQAAVSLDLRGLELDGAVIRALKLLRDEVEALSNEREGLLGEREALRVEVERLKRFEERFEEVRAAEAAREVGEKGFYERTFLKLTSEQRDQVIVLFDAAETPTSELLNFAYQVGPDARVMSRRPIDVYTGWEARPFA